MLAITQVRRSPFGCCQLTTIARTPEPGWMPRAKDHRFDLCALSPDLHKVVEHVHAYLDQALQAWRRSLWPEKPTDVQCKEKLEQLFYAIKARSIADDVDSLPATYQAVIDNAGLYAPPPLR